MVDPMNKWTIFVLVISLVLFTLPNACSNEKTGEHPEEAGIMKIFIYLEKEPTLEQIEELESLGVTVYLDSWIPPVEAHPAGFLVADIPADKLDQVNALKFILRVESAEETHKPQPRNKP
jgi:hypothetical protein